ncbi:GerE family regulatory protein [Salmonella enterica subsp. arizonae]|uniref:GerE family regulatory protein n=1 Tax=Salmonella enterica subsp. arizonae TaxID=59203 RepID=A0A379S8V6_SALER|nr:GerE family regulatory protein [Salmonella enterica subsp. arizonae]
MQYKNKLKHINIKNGILLLAEKFNLTLSEKKGYLLYRSRVIGKKLFKLIRSKHQDHFNPKKISL